MEMITISAKTLDEAITKALIELQITSDHLHYEIIQKETSGLFGIFGAKPCVIRARAKSEEEERAGKAEKAPVKDVEKKPERKPERKSEKKPAEKAAERPMERSADRLAERSTDRPTERKAPVREERAAARPAERKPERPAGKPAERVMEKPVEKDSEKPEEKTFERSYERPERKEYPRRDNRRDYDRRKNQPRREEFPVKEEKPAEPAKPKQPLQVDAEKVQKDAKEFLLQVFGAMGMEVAIETELNVEEGELLVMMNGEDMGILIGKRGQTLDSLQYLVSLVVNKETEGYLRVKLDTENYRERRKETLETLARNISYKVKRTKRPVALEPMNPYERRIIHSALQNDRYVVTRSEGEDPFRHVVISLKRENYNNGGGRRNYQPRRDNRDRENRPDRYERPERTERPERAERYPKNNLSE